MENNIEEQYLNLLRNILESGVDKSDRTGTGTRSVFGRQIRHDMKLGFPLLTTKKMYWKGIATELIWFLRGETNIKYLVDNNVNIWVGDAFKKYCECTSGNDKEWNSAMRVNDDDSLSMYTKEEFIEKIKTDSDFAEKWGELGPTYGKQWRKWELPNYSKEHVEYGEDNELHVDQIQNLVHALKNGPDSRRIMVNAWNVGEVGKMTLPPCHYGFQVWTRELTRKERMDYWFKNNKPNRDVCDEVDAFNKEKQQMYFDGANVPRRELSLMWNQRSVDTFLGLPFNIASYAILLEILAKMTNMIPGELIGNLGDTHLYQNHLEQARRQLERDPYSLPTMKHNKTRSFYQDLSEDMSLFDKLEASDFEILKYSSHPAIKAKLSN